MKRTLLYRMYVMRYRLYSASFQLRNCLLADTLKKEELSEVPYNVLAHEIVSSTELVARTREVVNIHDRAFLETVCQLIHRERIP